MNQNQSSAGLFPPQPRVPSQQSQKEKGVLRKWRQNQELALKRRQVSTETLLQRLLSKKEQMIASITDLKSASEQKQ